mgnify:CR=1 FL=1
MSDASDVPGLSKLPDRFERIGVGAFIAYVVILTFFIWSVNKTGVSLKDLVGGFPQMGRLIGEMLPPSTARLEPVGWALLETFQMALVGTVAGVLLSVPIAVLATPHLSPHPVLYHMARNLIAFFRTVPDLVWALIFSLSGSRSICWNASHRHRQNWLLWPLLCRSDGRNRPRTTGSAVCHGGWTIFTHHVFGVSCSHAVLHQHLTFQPRKSHSLVCDSRLGGRRRHRHRAEGRHGLVQL